MKSTKTQKNETVNPATIISKFMSKPTTIISAYVTDKKTGIREEGYLGGVNLQELKLETFIGTAGHPLYFVQCFTWKKAVEIPENEFVRLTKLFARIGKACRIAIKTGKPVYVSFK